MTLQLMLPNPNGDDPSGDYSNSTCCKYLLKSSRFTSFCRKAMGAFNIVALGLFPELPATLIRSLLV